MKILSIEGYTFCLKKWQMIIPIIISIPATLSVASIFTIAVTWEEILRNMLIVFGMLILVYGIYFIATDVQFNRNINETR